MKFFITGVAGFLRSHLEDRMLELGYEVMGIDNLIGGLQEKNNNNTPNTWKNKLL